MLVLFTSVGHITAAIAADTEPKLRLAPMELPGGSSLVLVSPQQWAPLANTLSRLLRDTHNEYQTLLGRAPSFNTTLRLIDRESFYEATGAPEWTNAMYFRGEISVPLDLDERIDMVNLKRAVRHEYLHAVVNSFSDGRCPGWLDEGLAQWVENAENPALAPALRGWLKRNKPIDLDLLQGGFTRLEVQMVPPAYAQSLFATDYILNKHGIDKIKSYLAYLRQGIDKQVAFKRAYGISVEQFEQKLGVSMRNWSGKQRYIVSTAQHRH